VILVSAGSPSRYWETCTCRSHFVSQYQKRCREQILVPRNETPHTMASRISLAGHQERNLKAIRDACSNLSHTHSSTVVQNKQTLSSKQCSQRRTDPASGWGSHCAAPTHCFLVVGNQAVQLADCECRLCYLCLHGTSMHHNKLSKCALIFNRT
jgi:hypothetical protein